MGEFNHEIRLHREEKGKVLKSLAQVRVGVSLAVNWAISDSALGENQEVKALVQNIEEVAEQVYNAVRDELDSFNITGRGEISYYDVRDIDDTKATSPSIYVGEQLVQAEVNLHLTRIKLHLQNLPHINDEVIDDIMESYSRFLNDTFMSQIKRGNKSEY